MKHRTFMDNHGRITLSKEILDSLPTNLVRLEADTINDVVRIIPTSIVKAYQAFNETGMLGGDGE